MVTPLSLHSAEKMIDMAEATRTHAIVNPAMTSYLTEAMAMAEDARPLARSLGPLMADNQGERFFLVGQVVAATDDTIGLRFLRGDGTVGLGVATRPPKLAIKRKAFQSSPLGDRAAHALRERPLLLRGAESIHHVILEDVLPDVLRVRMCDSRRSSLSAVAVMRRSETTIPLLPFMV